MDTIELLLAAIVTIALAVYLIHFLARRISQRLGEKAACQDIGDDRRPLIRSGFVLSLLLIFLGGYGFLKISRWWPPAWVQQRALRSAVLERVEDSGGWERLASDVKLLAATNDSGLPIRFWVGQTNVVLPESIVQLRPFAIEVNPHLITNTVMFQFIRGRRSLYSLWVAPEITREEALATFRTKGSNQSGIRQLAPGVYEIY